MIKNEITTVLMNRKSIRKYTKKVPADDVIETVVRAGMQAPFASQLYSVLLSKSKKNYWEAPLLFTICVDCHKLKLFMAKRGWKQKTNDLFLLLLGIQDATLAAENMVIAAESLGLGSCFIGDTPYRAEKIARKYKLPPRVFPLVQLIMGYPDEDPPTRPRYPLDYVLFEDKYPELNDEDISKAMSVMDKGYLEQNYYLDGKFMIKLENDREETFTFDNYSWTEHISRKWGKWNEDLGEILDQFAKRGFNITI